MSVNILPPPNLSGALQGYTYAAREILANCTSPACRKNRELEHSIMSISRNVMISLPRQTFLRHLSVLEVSETFPTLLFMVSRVTS